MMDAGTDSYLVAAQPQNCVNQMVIKWNLQVLLCMNTASQGVWVS